MNANPSGIYPSCLICILSCMGCMFLAGVVKWCLLFCETSLTSSILCEAGKEGRAYKGHTEEECPSCWSSRAQAENVCAGIGAAQCPFSCLCGVRARGMRQSTPVFPPKGLSCSYWQEVLLTKVVSNWPSEHIQV